MILVTVTLLLCAVIISAAAGVAPSFVIAQQEEEDTSLGEEEEEEEEDLASGIVSNVLDGSGGDDNEEENDDGAAGDDDTNTQVAVPVTDQDQDQDQGAANLALNEALDMTVQRTPTPTPPPPDDGGLPPECTLEITADKEIYGPEDVVVITITNTGDEPLVFPDAALGLQIKNVDTGEVFPLVAAQVITTLEPGESRTFEFTYEELVSEIGTGLISATVVSECGDGVAEEVTFRLLAAPPEVESPGENGKIAFISNRDGGNWDINVMNPDGSEQTRLTSNPDVDEEPSWSPDGTKIAFTSYREGGGEVFVMNADGSEQTNISNNHGSVDGDPDWGPATDTEP
jgi:hypothetical protein